MSKGTILYIGNFELPDKGASANRVMNNRKLFSALGYRVVMLGISHEVFGGVRKISYDEDIYEEAYPVSIVEWTKHIVSVKCIATLVEKYSDTKMILLYNAPYLLVKNCKRFFRKKKIKVCYDCTEWTSVTDGSLPKRLAKRLDCCWIQTKLGKEADGLIVVSKLMQRHYQDNPNLLYLPPLVDVNDSIWHPENPYMAEKFEFCFAGMLDGDKDSLDIIVEAFYKANRRESLLRIIGVTKEEFLSYYPKSAVILEKLGDSVVFMGWLSHTETIRYVLGCGCYIFVRKPDLRNNAGFPTKFAEAYTGGIQMIATNISDIVNYKSEIVQILPCVDCDAIAKAMLCAIRKNLQNGICNEFDYRCYFEQAELFLKQIMEELRGKEA